VTHFGHGPAGLTIIASRLEMIRGTLPPISLRRIGLTSAIFITMRECNLYTLPPVSVTKSFFKE